MDDVYDVYACMDDVYAVFKDSCAKTVLTYVQELYENKTILIN